MPNSITTFAELTRIIELGTAVKYLFFWGHQPQRDGSVGAGCLSQWWPAAFTIDGLRFATAEHYMMWSKATLFNDQATAGQILAAVHPHQVKALGRQVHGFREEIWKQSRFDIVVTANLAKFGQHADLRRFLLGTGERILVEASPVDRIWGIGLAVDDDRAHHPHQWRGLNLLGFALMRVRAHLRTNTDTPPQ